MQLVSAMVMLTALFLISGCGASYPLDIPKEEWKEMSVENRIEARQKAAELERAREERRAAEAAAREAEALKSAEELSKARREADYGQRVQCVLRNAEGYLGGDWRSVEPIAIDLVTGLEIKVELTEASDDGLHYSREGYASFNGQTVQICDRAADSRSVRSRCARLLGTFQEFRHGLSDAIQHDRFLRGHLRCDLVPPTGAGGGQIIWR